MSVRLIFDEIVSISLQDKEPSFNGLVLDTSVFVPHEFNRSDTKVKKAKYAPLFYAKTGLVS